MSILDLLEHDHDTIAQLVREAANEDERVRREAIRQLVEMVEHHAPIDHGLLHDALRAAPEAAVAIAESERDEDAVRSLLPGLRGAASEDARPALQRLEQLVAAHAAREAETVFPLARRVLGDRRLEELFYEAERRKHRQSLDDSLIFPADRFGIE